MRQGLEPTIYYTWGDYANQFSTDAVYSVRRCHGDTNWLVGWFMVFNATFNNISAISWRSVLLVEETGGHGESHRPVASHWQTLSHNVVHLALIEIRTPTTPVAISTDCIGSCKSNYHTITTTSCSFCSYLWNCWLDIYILSTIIG